ncbi:hypothetical protein [uncultured Methylophaga sp.]|uniref:hypothetical protein n=1 Tax=uncultured Methylophaga sp. TaxID=285271 RepID=UPI0026321E7C|nr:hypothetical protein [uncultured Methylophaga sp.]
MTDLRRVCFFCDKEIEERKTLEHIIPDALLGKMGIKEVKVTGNRVTQYSRIKVPAHSTCNSGFGSKYEDKILELLEDPEALYKSICVEELSIPMMYGPDESITSIITTWLSKIYYGMFYDDFLKTDNKDWHEVCSNIINSPNFDFVRKSYKNGHGFQLPSSLFVFKTNNDQFDLVTMVDPSTILVKIGKITLVLCVCDGFLTKNYLNSDPLKNLRDLVKEEDRINSDFPSHKLALAEIVALRTCIPKTPKFSYSNHQIVNMSLSTLVSNPDEVYRIDTKQLKETRRELLEEFGIRLPT